MEITNDTVQAWANMSLPRMLVTLVVLMAIGAGFVYDKFGKYIQWVTPLDTSIQLLQKHVNETPYDYIGVFEYKYATTDNVQEISKACAPNYDSMC